jgi:electron transfer flavoprotein beta subunit
MSYGSQEDVQILRKGIAMGADKLVLVTGGSDDPYMIGTNLKMALEALGDVDLVLAGRQSADMDRGIIPGILAGLLGWIFLPQVSGIESTEGAWIVNQITETGARVMRFEGKAVVSITDDATNVPRIPPVRRILAAKKAPVERFDEIQVPSIGAEEISVEIPKMETICEFLPVENMGQTAQLLLGRLKEERYL